MILSAVLDAAVINWLAWNCISLANKIILSSWLHQLLNNSDTVLPYFYTSDFEVPAISWEDTWHATQQSMDICTGHIPISGWGTRFRLTLASHNGFVWLAVSLFELSKLPLLWLWLCATLACAYMCITGFCPRQQEKDTNQSTCIWSLIAHRCAPDRPMPAQIPALQDSWHTFPLSYN